MLVLIGIAIVFSAVVGGYVMERGNVLVLLQPAELLIIVGSAAGITLVANSTTGLRRILSGALSVFTPPPYTPAFYRSVLKMLYELFSIGRRQGMPTLENHIEDPDSSEVFKAYPEFSSDASAMTFLCDSLRMVTAGIAKPNELEHLMDLDAEVQRRERQGTVNAVSMLADSLPGLGIVAAVLGVVLTMQALGSAPEQIGQKVAAALVGTFLGIVLCYGMVGPLAAHLESRNEGHSHLMQSLYAGVHVFARGSTPLLAAEFARRSIPVDLRPSFEAMRAIFRREVRMPAAQVPGGHRGTAKYVS